MHRVIPASLYEEIVRLRRDLHQHPELSWQETRTAGKICEYLDELRIPFRADVAGTGVIATVGSELEGPCIALRADMDALPVKEDTGLPFASCNEGVMHACGHDGHTAMLLGAASLLKEAALSGPVRLIFQPAEETGAGAEKMIEAGALEGVDAIFGGHVDRHYPTGSIAITNGTVNASADEFWIRICGKGGHAARPHEAIDSVVVGSLLVMSIQTIVSREVNPAHPSVVTVGRFDAGTAHNVIASEAELQGTIRCQDSDVREHLHHSIRRIATAVGQLHDAQIDVTIRKGTPVVSNNPSFADLARVAATAVIGPENVLAMEVANMGGEDFGFYLQHVPGCYVRLGAQKPGKEGYPAHSSRFDFDEQVLGVGAAYFAELAKVTGKYLSENPAGRREYAAESPENSGDK